MDANFELADAVEQLNDSSNIELQHERDVTSEDVDRLLEGATLSMVLELSLTCPCRGRRSSSRKQRLYNKPRNLWNLLQFTQIFRVRFRCRYEQTARLYLFWTAIRIRQHSAGHQRW